MAQLLAQVRNGRLVVDAPTDLPEGSEVALVVADSWDALDDEDRAALERALVRSEHAVQMGQTRPASTVLDELDQRFR